MIYLELFLTFFKIGLFTFGGGYAMIPMISAEVTGRGWLDLPMVVDFIAVSESTPGPFAVNIATFVGMHTSGLFGAFCATLGVILPSFIVILIIAKLFKSFKDNFYVKGVLYGLRPAVIGLIASAALSVGLSIIFVNTELFGSINAFFLDNWNFKGILILAIAAVVFFRFKLKPVPLLLLSAGLGIVFYGILAETGVWV